MVSWPQGFLGGLISLSELKLEYMKAHRNAYDERMTEAQEQQLERRLTKLCQVDWLPPNIGSIFDRNSRNDLIHTY